MAFVFGKTMQNPAEIQAFSSFFCPVQKVVEKIGKRWKKMENNCYFCIQA
jgi:hypothetical protein